MRGYFGKNQTAFAYARAVPHTSIVAPANTTIRYGLLIADNGLERAVEIDPGLKNGVNIYDHRCVNRNVARGLGYDLTSI